MVSAMFIQPGEKTIKQKKHYFAHATKKHRKTIADKDQLTSYVSTKARKEFGNASAYDVNAANSLWFVSPKVPCNELDS
jgi:hypothetical protein